MPDLFSAAWRSNGFATSTRRQPPSRESSYTVIRRASRPTSLTVIPAPVSARSPQVPPATNSRIPLLFFENKPSHRYLNKTRPTSLLFGNSFAI